MGGAQPCEFREGPKRNCAFRVALDFAAHAPNEIRMRGAACVARMAALARAESGLFRHFRLSEEKNLVRARPARWARRPTVDPCRANGVDERAIHARIVQRDRGEEFPLR